MYRIFVFAILLRSSAAVIYSMNETEYNKMPPLYGLDDYSSCLLEAGGTYCVADFGLVGKNSLMHMIKEYSEYRLKHFNHTQIHRGICVSNTCKRFKKDPSSNTERSLSKTLEVCLNDTIYRNYELEVKLENIRYCKKAEDKKTIDNYDLAVAIVYLIIIGLNALGTIYDKCRKDKKSGNKYLLAFSISQNWGKLVAPSGRNSDPRINRLKLFHSMRAMTIICVIFSHTVLVVAYAYVDNPLFIEKAYEDPLKQILFNGSLVVHTFFVMSSFLMAYNLELTQEKKNITLASWPLGILMRWLRLSPAYALVLATICTWMRHIGSGPLWDLTVITEANACRQYWWAHLLYINNYVYNDAYCAPQTWYLAADTQLFCFGLLMCLLFRKTKSRLIAMGFILTIGLLIVAMHTYFQDLEAVVLQSPETYRTLYASDNTFRLLYIRGHTNLSTYSLGLTGGFLTYYLQNQKKQFNKHKIFRWIMWLLVPLGVSVILTGGFFYMDGSKPSTTLKVLYAVLYKPIFQILVITLIMGVIFKIETVIRGILEWRGFTWMGRVSYGAFLVHTMFQRGLVGSLPRPIYLTEYYVVIFLSATIFLSFASASLLFVLVEAPIGGIVHAVTAGSKKEDKEDGDK
ncbi:unnamed protein product [Diatraea saccharalis]|uniref:Acyltransferase 3 domain-containing protein n=1 Tax=Diatraea saccharalis TaxID=40085 RepID=A0A9N9RG88_9NEOP|nr:unnamed protein product [Diatraea saccharalis]